MKGERCPNCGVGVDTDGDGDCALCGGRRPYTLDIDLPDVRFERVEGARASSPAEAVEAWMADCVLPDPIERAEAAAEDAFLDATAGLPEGKWRCPGCDQVRDLDDMHPISAHPYAEPGCGACLEEAFPELARPSLADFLKAHGHGDLLDGDLEDPAYRAYLESVRVEIERDPLPKQD